MGPGPILYAPLLERLRNHGFIVTTDQHCLIYRLLESLGPDCGPAQLRDILCPVLAKTPEQQQVFRSEFEWYMNLKLLEERSMPVRPPQPRADLETPAKERFTRRRRILLVALVIAAIAIVALLVPHLPKSDSSARPKIWEGVDFKFKGTGSGFQILSDRSVGVVLLAFLIAIWYIMIRTDIPLRSVRADAPPYAWPVVLPAAWDDWQKPDAVKTLRSALSARKDSEHRQVDWEATVRATVAGLGWPDVRFARLRAPSDYVFLIERRSDQDHLARFYTEALLQIKDSVQLDCYFYEGTPSSCYTESPAIQVPLSNIARGHPEGTVIILGSATSLIDPVTGRLERWADILKAWTDRAILLADHPTDEELRELKTHTWLSVAIGTIEEMRRIARATDFGGVRPMPGADRIQLESTTSWKASGVPGLRDSLGPEVFRWLCACALHHELIWSISIGLSRVNEVMSNLPDETSIFSLFRLNWFRLGSIPALIRSRLAQELPKDVEIAARKAIIELLRNSKPPQSSYASLATEFDIRAHETAIAAIQRPDKDRKPRKEFPRLVTGTESSLDFIASPRIIRMIRSSQAVRSMIDGMVAVVIATSRFILYDYGDEDHIFFILLATYAALFTFGIISLFM